jgi:hypothetical protein
MKGTTRRPYETLILGQSVSRNWYIQENDHALAMFNVMHEIL